jgi:hypothetical protein
MENMLAYGEQDHLVPLKWNSADRTKVNISVLVRMRRPHKVVSSDLWMQGMAVLPKSHPFSFSVIKQSKISLGDESCSLSCNNTSLSILYKSQKKFSIILHSKKSEI